ncbi:DNA polymerase III subunit beta [Streptacidiphilus sp. ASG 303]|uniref:DNA polymerase III subunit beta n=1 Tax=Streptacidiphilus sp. ASG 303 TaxID=2896847 RepID=UPI001E4E3D8B|nr:DNA polymerase III subunit beta [Streptacidiphilus sp. ASG 303]MCD0482375.1 DNA polymerase III subunit beta [Streptacidiphilus sp. ASG 303]
MRFRIERGALADAVAWAGRALPARTPLPVLGGLLLEASDGRLSVSGHDLEVSARTAAEADTAEPGRVLVAGRRLLDVCRVLPDGPVECVREGARLAVACGGVRFGLAALPMEDYPALPAVPEVCGELDAAALAAAVAQTAVAAGRDDTLPVLTGVRIDLHDDTLVLAATDRYRFAVRTLDWRPLPGRSAPSGSGTDKAGTGGSVVVPARRLLDAARALAGAGTVRLALDDGVLGLEGGGAVATMRLIDGVLPRHERLFALDGPAVVVAERAPLAEAVRRVAVVADRHGPVRLDFSAGSLLLEAGAGDDDTASQRLPAALSGPATHASFNPAYLADALGALEAPYVQFSLLGPGQRVLLAGRGTQDGPEEPGHHHLLMALKNAG